MHFPLHFMTTMLAAVFAYPLNAANGSLVTLLVWASQVASAMLHAGVPTPAVTLTLVAPFYARRRRRPRGALAGVGRAPRAVGRALPSLG